jgi:hypothetical protein
VSKSIKGALFSVAVVVMVIFGLTGFWIGAPEVLRWKDLSARTVAYYGVSLFAGLALLVCSVLSLRKSWRLAMALGGIAAATVLVLNQFIGLKYQAILCFTPI